MTWLFSKAMMERYGNSHCSQGQEEESLEESCSGGEPYAQLNVKPTPHKFWRNDKMMDHSNLSRFGLTLRLLTDDHGEAVLMSFLEGFPVRTLAAQEREKGSQAQGQDCGPKWRASLTRYDHDMSSWKTHQCSLLGGSEEFSETWPRWGLMRDGECWEQIPPGFHIIEPEYGWLPTARASMATHGICWARAYSDHKGNLEDFLAQKLVQTGVQRIRGLSVSASFVTLLMGWPQKWTSLKPLETDRFQRWQQQHSAC